MYIANLAYNLSEKPCYGNIVFALSDFGSAKQYDRGKHAHFLILYGWFWYTTRLTLCAKALLFQGRKFLGIYLIYPRQYGVS